MNTLRAITEVEVFYAKPSTFNYALDYYPAIDVDMTVLSAAAIQRLPGGHRMKAETGRQLLADFITLLRDADCP